MTAEEEEAKDRLLFHLENQTGFWFGLVVGDDPAPRERLCEAARKWCEEHGRAFYLHADGPGNLVTLPVVLSEGNQPGIHWIRTDGVDALIESWNARAAAMLMAMNERREAYRVRLDGGIVVEGRGSLKRILREMAPDMFSIRAFVIEPGEDHEREKSDIPEWRLPSLDEPYWLRIFEFSRVSPGFAGLSDRVARNTLEPGIISEALTIPDLLSQKRLEEAETIGRSFVAWSDEQACAENSVPPLLDALISALLGFVLVVRGADGGEAFSALERADRILSTMETTSSGRELSLDLHREILWLKASLAAESGRLQAAKDDLERCVALLGDKARTLTEEERLALIGSLTRLCGIIGLEGGDDFETAARALQIAQESAAARPEDDRWKLELVRAAVFVARSSMRRDPPRPADALAVLLPRFDTAVSVEKHEKVSARWREVLQVYFSYLAFLGGPEDERDRTIVTHAIEWVIPRRIAAWTSMSEAELSTDAWAVVHLCLKLARACESKDAERARSAIREAMKLIAQYPAQTDSQLNLKHQVESLRAFVESGPKPS